MYYYTHFWTHIWTFVSRSIVPQPFLDWHHKETHTGSLSSWSSCHFTTSWSAYFFTLVWETSNLREATVQNNSSCYEYVFFNSTVQSPFLLFVCLVFSSRVSPGMRVYLKAHQQVLSSEWLIQAGGPGNALGFTQWWNAMGMFSVLVCFSIQLGQLHNTGHMIRLLMITFTGKKGQSQQSSLEYLHHYLTMFWTYVYFIKSWEGKQAFNYLIRQEDQAPRFHNATPLAPHWCPRTAWSDLSNSWWKALRRSNVIFYLLW